MALRAFKTTVLIAIDDQESINQEIRENPEPVSLEELKEYLRKALVLDVNVETHGNQVGWQSAEIDFEALTELNTNEVNKLYNVPYHGYGIDLPPFDHKKLNNIRVIKQSNQIYFDLVGKTVAFIRTICQTAFNISKDDSAIVNGKEVQDDFVVQSGQTLEFIQKAKGKS